MDIWKMPTKEDFLVVNHIKVKKKILIIDDDESITTMLSMLMDPLNVDIKICHSIGEGVKAYDEGDYSLVVLDHLIKGRVGVHFIKLTDCKDIIYYTGSFHYKEFTDPFKENILKIVRKPNIQLLVDEIKSHLKIRKGGNVKEVIFKQSVKQISKDCHKSTRQVNRDFKKTFGKSPQKLLNDKNGSRITMAKKLLLSGKTVNDVVKELGFDYRESFQRFFKKRTGDSPSHYARIHPNA